MTERELDVLEQYLDGALESGESAQLEIRLGSDAGLASALGELKAQRAVRSAIWVEPDDSAAQRLVWRIRGAIADQQRSILNQPSRNWLQSWSSWQIARIGSAAAACLVLGFMFGRIGGNSGTIAPRPTPGGTPVILPAHPVEPPATPIASSKKYSVPITNEYGQVVAWQDFDNAEQAKNFTEDLHGTHAQPSGPAVAGQSRMVDQQVPQVPF